MSATSATIEILGVTRRLGKNNPASTVVPYGPKGHRIGTIRRV